jgi:hypothetical protein
MFAPQRVFEGVEGLWIIWFLAVAVVLRMLWFAVRRWQRPNWAQLARGEDGLSYSLSYVLVMPFFFLFCCIVFEVTWLLVAKIGTLYAAHAGARSAIVWSSAQPANARTARINQAVWTAMTPFSTDRPKWANVPGEAWAEGGDYALAYLAYANASGDPDANGSGETRVQFGQTLVQRYLSAASRTTWSPTPDQILPQDPVRFTVTYNAPLHIIPVARLFSVSAQWPYEYPISSTATLPNETPLSADRTLGIDYQSQ